MVLAGIIESSGYSKNMHSFLSQFASPYLSQGNMIMYCTGSAQFLKSPDLGSQLNVSTYCCIEKWSEAAGDSYLSK